jgi:acyl-CoA reductase-like NAD-dependent aldehyde dehydrogenase
MPHQEMLIDGHFIGGVCDYAVGKLVIKSPYDGSHVGTAAEGGWDEANAALGASQEAFLENRLGTPQDRHDLLMRAVFGIRDRGEELVEILVREIGKPVVQARAEVARMELTFTLAAKAALEMVARPIDLTYDPRGAEFRAAVQRFPVGPVLAIVPYNWPLNLAAHKLAPALACGCPVVLKPSNQAPLSTLLLARILHEAGAPPGTVCAVVVPSAIAEKLARDPRIAKVSFTGSPKVGWHLKSLLPQKRVTLELGADSRAIVAESADLDSAIPKLVQGAFAYAGQICISVQHIRVHRARYEEAREKLIEAVKAVAFGDPADERTVCGPVISGEDKARIESAFIDATVIAQSENRIGPDRLNLIAPTLVENVAAGSELASEEIFGPVVTLAPFDDLTEEIGALNASPYGIHVGLFSHDSSEKQMVFERATVGGVVINDVPAVRFDALPYGGNKQSGFGREGVEEAIFSMTEPKSWVERV